MNEIKVVGQRRPKESETEAEYDVLLKTVQALHRNRVCLRGLYRFKTFEEANQWMFQMVVRSSAEIRP